LGADNERPAVRFLRALRRPTGRRERDIEMKPPTKNVETRADGRPPEEARSDNPDDQARVILEDSEERLANGSEGSTAGNV
jgi:hypothetical protein